MSQKNEHDERPAGASGESAKDASCFPDMREIMGEMIGQCPCGVEMMGIVMGRGFDKAPGGAAPKTPA